MVIIERITGFQLVVISVSSYPCDAIVLHNVNFLRRLPKRSTALPPLIAQPIGVIVSLTIVVRGGDTKKSNEKVDTNTVAKRKQLSTTLIVLHFYNYKI